MAEKVVKLSPDALGYKDRGKMKWIGMMLSDHAEALKKQKETAYSDIILPKEQQDSEKIGNRLYQSYSHQKPIAIQLNVIKDGRYLPDQEGIVEGFKEDTIYLKTQDNSLKQLKLGDLRHIEWINSFDWYDKYEKKDSHS